MIEQERRKVFWVWCDMRARCNSEKHRQFKDYGGRGITVCPEWQGPTGFQAFLADMGARPAGYLLERDNNNLGYSPQNCRWATRTEQNSNRRNCIYVDCDGDTVTLKEYCRRKGLSYRPIVKRIQDRNWPIDTALAVPVGSGKVFGRIPERAA